MALVIHPPLEKVIPLNLPVEEDPDQEGNVTIRQATQAERELRSNYGRGTRVYRTDGSQEITTNLSYEGQKRYEVYLVMSGSNIMVPGDKELEYKPAFKFKKMDDGKMHLNMTIEQFSLAWGMLPDHWADAIHKAVLTVNPQWDPEFRSE